MSLLLLLRSARRGAAAVFHGVGASWRATPENLAWAVPEDAEGRLHFTARGAFDWAAPDAPAESRLHFTARGALEWEATDPEEEHG